MACGFSCDLVFLLRQLGCHLPRLCPSSSEFSLDCSTYTYPAWVLVKHLLLLTRGIQIHRVQKDHPIEKSILSHLSKKLALSLSTLLTTSIYNTYAARQINRSSLTLDLTHSARTQLCMIIFSFLAMCYKQVQSLFWYSPKAYNSTKIQKENTLYLIWIPLEMEVFWCEHSIRPSLLCINIGLTIILLKCIKCEDFIMACQNGLHFQVN